MLTIKVVPVVLLLMIQLIYGEALNGVQENNFTVEYDSPEREYLVLKGPLTITIIGPPCPPLSPDHRPGGYPDTPDDLRTLDHDRRHSGHHSKSNGHRDRSCRNSHLLQHPMPPGRLHNIDPKDINASCQPVYYSQEPSVQSQLISHYCDTNSHKEVTVLKIPEVTADMSTKISCEISKTNPKETFTVEFILKVKAGRRVWVEEDGNALLFTETGLFTPYYDGFYMYRFVEGNFVNLSCTNNYHNGYVVLEYHNAEGMLLRSEAQETGSKKSLLFQRTMRSKDHQSYVDCIYVKYYKEFPQNFTYRTIFTKDYFLLSIDETNTSQMCRRGSREDTYYIYNYVKGKSLKFTCEKTSSVLKGDIRVIYDKKTTRAFVEEIVHTDWRVTVLLRTEHLEGSRISCNSGGTASDTILFQMDTSHDWQTTIIIICVIIPVVAIIATLCACYWCKKTRSTNSVRMLNESTSQFNSSTGPNNLAHIDDYDYTYIENEYNYIGTGSNEYVRENSLYRVKNTNANPRQSNATISLSSVHTDNNYYNALDAKLMPTVNNTVNPTTPINCGTQDIGKEVLPFNIKNYENVHEENNKVQKEMNNLNYRCSHKKPLNLSNNIFEDNKITQKDNTEPMKENNIVRFSNLLKDNDVLLKNDEKPKENNI